MGGLFDRVEPIEFEYFANPADHPGPIYDEYLRKKVKMENIYKVIFIFYNVIGIVSFIIFFRLRNWYIIKQRNFVLTFINGIFAFITGFITLLTQFETLPCGVTLYVSDVMNPFYNSIFLSRSLRIVLLYQFNIFKVTAINKKKKIKDVAYMGTQEPNYYLPKIYEKVNKIIYAVIIIPTTLALGITIWNHRKYIEYCPFDNRNSSKNAVEQLKAEEGEAIKNLYGLAQMFGIVLAIAMIIMIYFISKVKDSSKYGAKFECLSTIFLVLTLTGINIIINKEVQEVLSQYQSKRGVALQKMQAPPYMVMENILNSNPEFKQLLYPHKIFLSMYNYTKGGRVLFCLISMYMIFAAIILPIIKCYNSKMEKNKYFHEPTSSIQYFYKVLNSPPLIEELKSIAIKEFSVENVLFWENYQILQKMIYRYQIEYRKAERVGNPKLISQYDFEGYYQQQLQAFSVSSMDDYSYDPNMPVPREIMPYYVSFYQTFIDSMGPASVNISGSTIKHIYREMCTCPTIGMFDNAKNEIVEMMYSSIFPILLRQNRKQLHNATING